MMSQRFPDARAHASTDNPDEVFDRVDEQDRVIGQVRRGDAHQNSSLLHRSVQTLLFDTRGRVLLQRRSLRKDLFPGYFCASASGHVLSGDDYETTALRELREELGVEVPLRHVGVALVRSPMESEMTALFVGRCDGPFTFDPVETDGGEFFDWDTALAARETLPMVPALLIALDAVQRERAAGGPFPHQ